MTAVEIVRYEDKYHGAALELQTRLWSPSVVLNQRYFQWKFVDNPHAALGEILLAVAGDRVVGMRGFMATLWTDPAGKNLCIPLAGDTVIAADYEGHGIVNRLSSKAREIYAERGIGLVMNTSSSPLVFWHSRRSGWDIVGQYAHMRLRLRPRWSHKLASEWRRMRGRLYRHPAAADPFGARQGESWSVDRRTVVSLCASIDPNALAELGKAASGSGKYTLLRDSAFFSWRFSNPLRKYYFLICQRHGSSPTAYLVISLQERDRGPDIRIVDWCYRQWDDFRCLLDAFARQFPTLAPTIQVNAFRATEIGALRDLGFQDVTHGGTPSSRAMKFRPGLLVTGVDSETIRALTMRGFDLIDFKGIESDGA